MGMKGLSILASVTACTGMAMLVWIFQELGGTKLLGFGDGVEAEKVNKDGGKEPADVAGAPEEQEVFTSYNEVYHNFDSMGLQENLLKGIFAYGFRTPSAIQERGIVPFSKGRDVCLQARCGTGKTATFSVGILQQLDYGLVECQALVLAPTCKLAQETEKVIRALGNYLDVKVHACTVSEVRCIGNHVVVGTPGRVLDALRRQALCADHIKMVVLDEANDMLTGYLSKDEVSQIWKLLPEEIQVGMSSATMSTEALNITKMLKAPVRILEKRDKLTLEGFNQFYVNVDEEWKLEVLCDICDCLVGITKTVVFVNPHRVNWLTNKMKSRYYTVSSAVDFDMGGNTDYTNIGAFRTGSSRVLITNSLLTHCRDAEQVYAVIIYDLPDLVENYLNLVGHGGRFERKGLAISFVTREDEKMLDEMQRFYNVNIGELPSNYADLVAGDVQQD